MESIKINDRLLTAVPYVREGARLCDVGTDHAYLPIYLLAEGRISYAIASDINKGPLEKARENINRYGLDGCISTVLCDGLRGIDSGDIDDVAVFGMGGELIVKIIDEAPWLKDSSKRLILQPMTHPEKLREYLAQSGFCVIGESISADRGKTYQTICAQYDGIKREYDGFTLLFGEYILKEGGELLYGLLRTTRAQLERKLSGKREGGEDISHELELLQKITKYIEREER